MKTLNFDPEDERGPEREHVDLTLRFIGMLRDHVTVQRADEDGTLRQLAQVLDQKRGCRR